MRWLCWDSGGEASNPSGLSTSHPLLQVGGLHTRAKLRLSPEIPEVSIFCSSLPRRDRGSPFLILFWISLRMASFGTIWESKLQRQSLGKGWKEGGKVLLKPNVSSFPLLIPNDILLGRLSVNGCTCCLASGSPYLPLLPQLCLAEVHK